MIPKHSEWMWAKSLVHGMRPLSHDNITLATLKIFQPPAGWKKLNRFRSDRPESLWILFDLSSLGYRTEESERIKRGEKILPNYPRDQGTAMNYAFSQELRTRAPLLPQGLSFLVRVVRMIKLEIWLGSRNTIQHLVKPKPCKPAIFSCLAQVNVIYANKASLSISRLGASFQRFKIEKWRYVSPLHLEPHLPLKVSYRHERVS